MMEAKEKTENPLTLKVMRLTRPTLSSPVIVTCESKDLPGHLFNSSLKNDITSINGAESLAVGQFLLVPQSFGSIYLGEIFSCYVSVFNDSNDPVPNIVLKSDLQTQSQSKNVLNNKTIDALKPKESFDDVIHHEVTETGTHILVCEVTYADNLSFRKFFKFQVLKPLDVKTKFYSSDDVYLEIQVQNITTGPISLEKVTFESAGYFKVADLNSVGKDQSSVFGNINVLDKDACRQYLYRLSPAYDSINSKRIKADNISVGIVDIVWRSNLGERGHLQTSMLQTINNDRGDLRFSVTEFPNIVFLEKPFQFSCRISNTSDHELNICIYFEEMKNLAWSGTSGKIKKILPSEHVDIHVQVIPLDLGLQVMGGLRLRDTVSQLCYEFDNLGLVFVLQE